MMHIFRIEGNTVQVVCCPPEDIRTGDYLIIEDIAAERGLIVQVVNTGYANVPGILEDILRESSKERIEGQDFDPLRMRSYVEMIKDAKLFTCKVRRAVDKKKLSTDTSWIPSRSTSVLKKLQDQDLLVMAGIGKHQSINIGKTKNEIDVSADLATIDGRLNIITGKKGTGKSHLSKLLVLGLISYGGVCIVFDVNGEYVNLGYTKEGKESPFLDNTLVLTPGKNFKVSLEYAGLSVLLSIMGSALDLPSTSAWEIRRIWNGLMTTGLLSLKKLGDAIQSVTNNYVRDALIRRYESIINTGLFTDSPHEMNTLEELFDKIKHGGALIINLRDMPSSFRHIIVEFMLSKLCRLLERWIIKGVFLFAEEAHLYLRETYWDDIVTRMRHLGIFTTFITNQPDSIQDGVYRQADNIFLFNFTNENDIAAVSRASRIDVETVNIIARELPPYHCLALGKAVDDFPLIVRVRPLNVRTMGETRLFFSELRSN